ncbi:mucoidy inhibitor MuiA family protein [Aquimarina sediminis]|uniref:mucoidy inhibitor MuiA family protein n=1 Tax=Aquimarina sediminis TaxID=2070536 RepID=UPI000CA07293|nr:mucoidy inhibitor MuiA family protein [Aquimarina sediminis]
MRTYTLLLLLFSFSIANSAEKKTPSAIEEVTIYLTGAQIKRTAIANLTQGTNEIILNNLSANIDENSIQVSGLKNATILSINFAINYLEKKKDSEELESLRNKLKEFLLKKNSLDNIISGLRQEEKLLDNNQQLGSDTTPISLDKIKEISTYYRNRSTAIKNDIYSTTQKIDKLSSDIDNIRNEMIKLGDHIKEERGEIRIKLDAPTVSNLKLEIRYNVSNAGWFPFYDIKSESIKKPLNIAYKANVYQQTGTDWKNANIILSTGDPNTNNIKPDLTTKYLNFTYGNYRRNYTKQNYGYKYNPTIRKVTGIITDEQGVPLPGVNVVEKGTSNGTLTDFDGKYTIEIQGGRELSFSYVGFSIKTIPIYSSSIHIKLEEDVSQLEEVVVVTRGHSNSLSGRISGVEVKKEQEKREYNQIVETKETGITNTRFKIKKKYTIKSNADITVIEIDNFDMNTNYQYYAAPELNENVFLTAKLGNWEQFNLLAGEASIYFEGNFAGKTNINPLASSDSLTVSLGIDPNIVVKREQLDNFKSKSFIGSSKIINNGYKISIKNNRQNKINIILEDRIPISQNKEIRLDDLITNGSRYNNKTGIMRWKLDILPNQKTEKQFSYQVKYPKSRKINL